VRLENRLPAEGINASREHPLKEFAWLVVGAAAVIAVLAGAIAYGAQWLAPRIPIRYETRLVEGLEHIADNESESARAVQASLQALADRLAARMALPQGLRVRVLYHEGEAVNAFASLGGRAVFFRGLLEALNSEDALAMVMAHEIAHLKHRHPAAALGRGVALGIVLSLVSAELGRGAAGNMLSQTAMLTLLSFSRQQEREADEEALLALAAEYRHVGGALELFEIFMRAQAAQTGEAAQGVEFLRTHPLTSKRVEAARSWARAHGIALDGPRRALPAAILAERSAAANSADRLE
jgi:predicted Zn-dependent protease